MNILVVRSNPRHNGYTQQMTDLFVRGAMEAQATITDVNLASKMIKPCVGCYGCWNVTPGVCVMHDDMSMLLKEFRAADMVVFATPLYSFTMSSALKIFMERTLPLTKGTFEISPTGLVRNALRFPEEWPKKLVTISVGAFKGNENFDALTHTFALFANALNLIIAGQIIRPESYLLQFSLAKPKTIKIIELAFIRAGYEAATQGSISSETLTKASTPLSSDITTFSTYSHIYWEHALAMGPGASDVAALQKRVTSDVRILLSEMARSIDPLSTARLKALFQFNFTDNNQHFYIKVNKGTCELIEGCADNPDLRIVCTATIWAKLFMRQLDAAQALVKKDIVLEGEKHLFSKLDRYFPPPIM